MARKRSPSLSQPRRTDPNDPARPNVIKVVKWLKAALGLVVLGGFGWAAWSWQQGDLVIPGLPRPIAESTLPAGTEVSLLLLSPLDAGKSQEGDTVRLILAEPLKDEEGRVLVEAGAMAEGTVTRSRGASLGAELIGQPGRLEIDVQSVSLPDGEKIPLQIDKEDEEAAHAFSKENTGLKKAGDALASLWKHPESQKALAGVTNRLMGKESEADLDSPDMKKALKEIAAEMEMPATSALLDENRPKEDGTDAWASIIGSGDKISKGDFSGMSGAEIVLALNALGELGSLADGVSKGLKGAFKGSSIHAPVGTEVTCYTSEIRTLRPIM